MARSSKSKTSSKSSSKSFKDLRKLGDSVSTINTINPVEEYQKNTEFTGYFVIFIILSIINFVINVYALLWIYKLEEISCKCSENWKRDYIKYFLYAYFIMFVIQIIIYLATGTGLQNQNSTWIYVIMLIYQMFAFICIFVAIFYIDELKKQQCTCSEDIRREVYYYYNIIRLAFIGLALLIMILTLLFLGKVISNLVAKN